MVLESGPEHAFLIAGASGMLGTALQRVLGERGIRYEAPPESEFDITDEHAVRARVTEFADSLTAGEQGVLLNAAAYTNVEGAEDDRDRAFLVNATAPVHLAFAANHFGLQIVHVSTDFVFDGTKDGPYTEDDEPNPLSVYGESKLAGEINVFDADAEALVVRTAWVFGPNGANFPTKIVAAARERGSVSVVTDEIGSPTYTVDLARGIVGLVEAGANGLFHLAGSGSCSRYELAVETLRLAGLGDVPVRARHERPVPHARRRARRTPCSTARRPRRSASKCRFGLMRSSASCCMM